MKIKKILYVFSLLVVILIMLSGCSEESEKANKDLKEKKTDAVKYLNDKYKEHEDSKLKRIFGIYQRADIINSDYDMDNDGVCGGFSPTYKNTGSIEMSDGVKVYYTSEQFYDDKQKNEIEEDIKKYIQKKFETIDVEEFNYSEITSISQTRIGFHNYYDGNIEDYTKNEKIYMYNFSMVIWSDETNFNKDYDETYKLLQEIGVHFYEGNYKIYFMDKNKKDEIELHDKDYQYNFSDDGLLGIMYNNNKYVKVFENIGVTVSSDIQFNINDIIFESTDITAQDLKSKISIEDESVRTYIDSVLKDNTIIYRIKLTDKIKEELRKTGQNYIIIYTYGIEKTYNQRQVFGYKEGINIDKSTINEIYDNSLVWLLPT